ncbi:hypothetical protein B0A55_00754 [Friedmanniomyces simplex]|uniref:Uncharacterized protein n=1 Tax=Friedmanniomyces simplex TaxID=329884 RepID=A0A4U0Y522_9PEZI|nr:hypothetical protein B0A55_00754 [Friedmanniomyces simplex]
MQQAFDRALIDGQLSLMRIHPAHNTPSLPKLIYGDIESGYAELFGLGAVGLRSRGSLTSVYYRIRKRWGLVEVLKTAPETVADKMAVLRRAEWLPPDFLMKMGYLQGYAGPESVPAVVNFAY